MNTRRYPRTLLEAFPGDSWHGVITRYRKPLVQRVADVLCAVTVFGALGVLLFWELAK